MRHLAVGQGLKLAAKADSLALSAFEIGLFWWMAIMQLVLFTSPHLATDTAAFWFLMQVGMLIGFVTTYPVNWWLSGTASRTLCEALPALLPEVSRRARVESCIA